MTDKDDVYNTKLAKEHFEIGMLYYNRSPEIVVFIEEKYIRNSLKSACFHYKEAALLGHEEALRRYIKISVALKYPHLCSDEHLAFVKEGCTDLFNSFCEDELKIFKQEHGETE